MHLATILDYLSSSDPDVIEQGLDAIGTTKPPHGTELVMPYLEHENPEIRSAALFNLGQLGARNYMALCMNFCKHEQDGTALGVAFAELSDFSGPEVYAFLREVVGKGKILAHCGPSARMMIAEELGAYSDQPEALDLLMPFLVDETDNVRNSAVNALLKFAPDGLEHVWKQVYDNEGRSYYVSETARKKLNEHYGYSLKSEWTFYS